MAVYADASCCVPTSECIRGHDTARHVPTYFVNSSLIIVKFSNANIVYFANSKLISIFVEKLILPIMKNLPHSALNADILRNLGVLADSEDMLTRVAKYLRKLVKEQQKADDTLMSKEAFFEKLEKAENSIEEGKGKSFTNKSDMNAWLNSL